MPTPRCPAARLGRWSCTRAPHPEAPDDHYMVFRIADTHAKAHLSPEQREAVSAVLRDSQPQVLTLHLPHGRAVLRTGEDGSVVLTLKETTDA